jgi:hypothetical protein
MLSTQDLIYNTWMGTALMSLPVSVGTNGPLGEGPSWGGGRGNVAGHSQVVIPLFSKYWFLSLPKRNH